MHAPPPGHYLILGASGLAGSHLLIALKDMPGVRVRAAGGSRMPRVHGGNIEPLQMDAADPAQCAAVMDGVDCLLLCAGVLSTSPVLARDPLASVLTTLRVSMNALEAAWRAGVKRCVCISSTTAYPVSEDALTEDRLFEGEPPPGWHALGWMTRYVESLCRSVSSHIVRPMGVTVLRPSLIYGEYDHFDEASAHFLPSLVRRVVNREKPIEVWGDGTQVRDIVHGADVARAALLGLSCTQQFSAYNIAAGESHSVNDILARLIALDGFTDAKITHRLDKPQSAARRFFDPSLARAELGFTPAVSLDEGLTRTLAWYRAQFLEQG
jgi:GDP-L-fucose synthase